MRANRSSPGNDLAPKDRPTAADAVSAETETAIAGNAIADAAGLRYVAATEPGLRRLGAPGRFRYVDAQGRVVRDAATLDRIRALAIPPAYLEVWICTSPRGHLQATGRDARGRRQYRYHPHWQRARGDLKFDRMVAFGEALPRLRRRVARDLSRPGLPRDKVLALIVALLDATRVRIGNTAYARDNQSYGLTTLRSRHARFMDGRLRLRFRGKGGAEHDLVIDDRRLARIARRCQELPGQALFQYLDDTGERRGIDSDMVNAYLQAAMGDTFTAKDFRTWGATLCALLRLGATPLPEPRSARALSACITATVREVAAELRNTPTVCRKSYIHPIVFDAWREGRLQRFCAAAPHGRGRRGRETLALAFLRAAAPRTAAPAA